MPWPHVLKTAPSSGALSEAVFPALRELNLDL
jgi:hypothetical protein